MTTGLCCGGGCCWAGPDQKIRFWRREFEIGAINLRVEVCLLWIGVYISVLVVCWRKPYDGEFRRLSILPGHDEGAIIDRLIPSRVWGK